MSSHWEWVEEKIAEHDSTKPYAPENGQPLKFKVGDSVTYTNDYGVKFKLNITQVIEREKYDPCSYALGHRYLLDWTCHWVGVPENQLEFA